MSDTALLRIGILAAGLLLIAAIIGWVGLQHAEIARLVPDHAAQRADLVVESHRLAHAKAS